MKIKKLKESSRGDKRFTDLAAARAAEKEANTQTLSDIENGLNKVYRAALRTKNDTGEDYPALLVIGPSGAGKTHIIQQWCKDHNLKLIGVNAASLDPVDIGGGLIPNLEKGKFHKAGTDEWENTTLTDAERASGMKGSVIFLDELSRGDLSQRAVLLQLISDHRVPNTSSPTGYEVLDDVIFVVAAMNPGSYRGSIPLDRAEIARFYIVNTNMDPAVFLPYLQDTYIRQYGKALDEEDKLEIEGRLSLAEAILGAMSKIGADGTNQYDLHFTSDDEKLSEDTAPLTYRTFQRCLDISDGTKQDFLDVCKHTLDPKIASKIENLLNRINYMDPEDQEYAESEIGQERKETTQNFGSLADQILYHLEND